MKHSKKYLIPVIVLSVFGWILMDAQSVSLPTDVPTLEKLAKNKNQEAQLALAEKYLNGVGVEQDFKKAEKWFKKAAEEGNVEAQYQLGKLYFDGINGKPDLKNAIKWFQKGAQGGNARAMFMLGECNLYGLGEKQNDMAAVEWFKKSSYTGYAPAEYVMGQCYSRGLGITKNPEEAARLYRKAAEKGFWEAQYSLAVCYEEGFGVARNAEEADNWFQLAAKNDGSDFKGNPADSQFSMPDLIQRTRDGADNGVATDQNRLGNILFYGIGIPRDEPNALTWFEKAAEGGELPAQTKLGNYYFSKSILSPELNAIKDNPENIPQESLKWWRQAARNGDSRSQLYVGLSLMNEKSESAREEAVKMLKLAADQGDLRAAYYLALCYYIGSDDPKRESEGARWLKKAAEGGLLEAEVQWGWVLYHGFGVPESTSQAAEWWEKASDHGSPTATMLLVEDNYLNGKYNTALSWCRILDRQVGTQFVEEVRFLSGYDCLIEGNLAEALRLFTEGSDEGNSNSIFMLGYCYFQGWGVPQSYKLAFDRWQEAAKLDNQAATYYLGLCYETGLGATVDNREADRLFRKAAMLHPFDGQVSINAPKSAVYYANKINDQLEAEQVVNGSMLALLNLIGDSSLADARKFDYDAREMFMGKDSVAYVSDYDAAFDIEGHLYPITEFPDFVDEALYPENHLLMALNYLMARKEDPMALFNLGNMYYYGIDVPKDPWMAAAFYSFAYSRGNNFAMKRLEALEHELRDY